MLTRTTPKYIFFQNYILIFVVSLFTISCGKEELTSLQNTTVVDHELQSYFSLFEEEGKARGVWVDLSRSKIAGEIVAIKERNVAGQCSVNTSTEQKVVRIDKRYWASATTLEREFIIFHELGHCFLDRTHVNSKDMRGKCKSIMHSGTSGCQFRYTLASRATYLDELFN